jgi:hypothetical protein
MRSRWVWQGFLVGAIAVMLAQPARAIDIVSFSAAGPTAIAKDDVVDIVVGFAFTDLTVGGGFDLDFSPDVFAFQSFTFDSGLGDDPAFRLQPDFEQADAPFTIAFGSFSLLTGSRPIGILSLVAKEQLILGAGSPLLSAVDNAHPAGGFVSAAATPLSVQYQALLGKVVPEPSTLLLLAGGAAALWFRRNRGASA